MTMVSKWKEVAVISSSRLRQNDAKDAYTNTSTSWSVKNRRRELFTTRLGLMKHRSRTITVRLVAAGEWKRETRRRKIFSWGFAAKPCRELRSDVSKTSRGLERTAGLQEMRDVTGKEASRKQWRYFESHRRAAWRIMKGKETCNDGAFCHANWRGVKYMSGIRRNSDGFLSSSKTQGLRGREVVQH